MNIYKEAYKNLLEIVKESEDQALVGAVKGFEKSMAIIEQSHTKEAKEQEEDEKINNIFKEAFNR